MLHSILKTADKLGLVKSASAHCDIPCGIYDTGPALIAAVSVVRMMDILNEASATPDGAGKFNVMARNVATKEEEAEKVKHEIRVIWGDYVKAPIVEKYPHIHELAHKIMMKASACKQDVHREDGLALVELVNEFAEIFWATKGKKTVKRKCPYAPNLDVVYPVLEE